MYELDLVKEFKELAKNGKKMRNPLSKMDNPS